MDPLTQAGLGAAAAVVLSRRGTVRTAVVVGALAGAAPDLDVLIRSAEDPLLAIEYHRHFSHALLLAPVIGFVVALLYRLLFRVCEIPLRELVTFGVAGALTHGLLDACTSYGTRLYWPFSNYRESWDIISIVDPIFTLPLLFFTALAFILRRPLGGRIAMALCVAYLSFGVFQRERAQSFVATLAAERGHQPQDLTARTSFGNTLLWRTVYRAGERYYVDAVRLLPGTEPILYVGDSVEVFGAAQAEAWAGRREIVAQDVERFRHFSQGYLYQHPDDSEVLADLRYALLPDSVYPLWGIRRPAGQVDGHVDFVNFRSADRSAVDRLLAMLGF